MTAPSVSVILPTYNRAALLPVAIRSVLDQSYGDLELIVVDDASTDDTQQVLGKIPDARLRVICQSVNGGPSVARNAGIRAAQGRYIAFQDSDSEWLPEKLSRQVRLLEENAQSPAASYSRFVVVLGRKQIVRPGDCATGLSGHIYSRQLQGNTMGTPAILVRRDILDQLGYFDETMSNLEDWDLALRICAHHSVVFLDEVTLFAYVAPGSVNTKLSPESKVTILRKHYDAYSKMPNVMAPLTWSIGKDYAMRGEKENAVRYMNISVDLVPTAAKRLLRSAVSAGLNPYPGLYYALRLWWSRGVRAATRTSRHSCRPVR